MPDSKIDFVESEKILIGCRLINYDNVYSLNPTGHRGAISFQQHRAFMLAAALESFYGDKAKQYKIAVIGGGVAGLTLAAALFQMNFANVVGYEAKKILHKQEKSSQRLVHPDYNRWPMLGGLHNFTNFKFLNWSAAPASEVVKTIKEQFENIVTGVAGRDDLKFHEDTKLVDRRMNADNGKIELDFQIKSDSNPPKDEAFTEEFDIVILCTGLGVNSNDVTYWNPLSSFIGSIGDDSKDSITVFGTGDSALIDTFNCFLKKDNVGAHNEFWKMMLAFVSAFRYPVWSNVEPSKAHASNGTYSAYELKIRRHEVSKRAIASNILRPNSKLDSDDEFTRKMDELNKLSRSERDFYSNLIEGNIKTIEKHLRPYIFQSDGVKRGKLKMIGLLETPFQPTQAPINKLLLAYLLKKEFLVYEQMTRDESDAEIEQGLKRTHDEITKNPYICQIGDRNLGNSGDADYKRSEEIFAFDPLEALIANLMNYNSSADYIASESFSDPVHGMTEEYNKVQQFSPLVKDFFVRLGCVGVSAPSLSLDDKSNAWVIELDGHEKIMELSKKLILKGGLENSIAGFPIMWDVGDMIDET